MNELQFILSTSLVFIVFCILDFYSNLDDTKRYLHIVNFGISFIYSIFVLIVLFIESPFNGMLWSIQGIDGSQGIILNYIIIFNFIIIKYIIRALFTNEEITKRITKSFFKTYKNNDGKILVREPKIFPYRCRTDEEIVLKPKWIFAQKFMKCMAYIGAALFIVNYLNIAFKFVPCDIRILIPALPAIPFILCTECAWFLNGKKDYEKTVGNDEEDDYEVQSKYSSLWEEYNNLWPAQSISSFKISSKSQINDKVDFDNYDKMTLSNDVQEQITLICNMLKNRGITINKAYCDILLNIFAGKDVLATDINHEDFAPYLFPAINNILLENQRILVIVNNENKVSATVSWIKKWLKFSGSFDSIWNITGYNEELKNEREPDILVATPENFIQGSSIIDSQEEWVGKIEVVFFPEVGEVISEHASIIQCLVRKISDQLGRKPRFIILSKWYDGLNTSIRNILKVEPAETVVKIENSRNIYSIMWKTESDEWFQNKYFTGMNYVYLDAEPIIAIPALKHGISDLRAVYQQNNPFKVWIDEINNCTKYINASGFDPMLLNNVKDYFKKVDAPWVLNRKNDAFIIIRDYCCNIADTFTKFLSSGKNNCFIHIVSDTYLLRDYMCDNIEYLINSPRIAAPIMPRLSASAWSFAYILMERLSCSFVYEREIETILREVMIENEFIEDGIAALFKLGFGRELPCTALLEAVPKKIFNIKEKRFESVSQYRFPAIIKEKFFPEWLKFFDIKDDTGKLLGRIINDHIYQNYLPQQYHAFDGNMYKINKIDKVLKSISVVYEMPVNYNLYRQNRTYSIIGEIKSTNENKETLVKVGDYAVNIRICEAGEYHVDTDGYFDFHKGINLTDNAMSYVPLGNEVKEDCKRCYENRSILEVNIEKSDNNGNDFEKIAYTLSVILNEIFCSVFPHNYKFLSACTSLSKDFWVNSTILSERLNFMCPKLKNNKINTNNNILLYIFEDSHIDLGLLESVKENWFHIIDIIDDYLCWLLKGTYHEVKSKDSITFSKTELIKRDEFLKFGGDKIPEELDLEGLSDVLSRILINNKSIKQNRRKSDEAKSQGIENDLSETIENNHSEDEIQTISEI